MKKQLSGIAWLFYLTTLQAQFYIQSDSKVIFADSVLVTLRNIDFENHGALSTGNSTLLCTGKSNQVITSGGAALFNFYLEKPSGFEVSLGDDMRIENEIKWRVPGARLRIYKSNLYLAPESLLTDYGADSYIMTDNNGYVVRETLDAAGFLFPVGADDVSYNPIQVLERGTPDHIGVRCLPASLENGFDGQPIGTDVIATAWDIVESEKGESDLLLTGQWTSGDELVDFDRNNCTYARFDFSNGWWVLDPSSLGPAGGNDPFTRSRKGVPPGLYTIGDGEMPAFFDAFRQHTWQGSERTANQSATAGFTIYPNPCQSYLQLKVDGLIDKDDTIAVTLLDISGNVVDKQTAIVNAGSVIHIRMPENAMPGYYTVHITNFRDIRYIGRVIRID